MTMVLSDDTLRTIYVLVDGDLSDQIHASLNPFAAGYLTPDHIDRIAEVLNPPPRRPQVRALLSALRRASRAERSRPAPRELLRPGAIADARKEWDAAIARAKDDSGSLSGRVMLCRFDPMRDGVEQRG